MSSLISLFFTSCYCNVMKRPVGTYCVDRCASVKTDLIGEKLGHLVQK